MSDAENARLRERIAMLEERSRSHVRALRQASEHAAKEAEQLRIPEAKRAVKMLADALGTFASMMEADLTRWGRA